jgi:hypothetical protein
VVERLEQPRIERERPRVAGLALVQDRPSRFLPALIRAVARVPPRRAVDRLAAARAPIPRRDFALFARACYRLARSMG